MKRHTTQQTIRASIAIAAAVIVAALSGCASLGAWNYTNEQASLADFGGGGGDGGGSGDSGGSY